jgi:putative methionine-R-sulfoxide reductase with GAF domain
VTTAHARDDGGDGVVKRHGFLQLLVDEAPLPQYDEVLRDAAAHGTSSVELEELTAEHKLALQLRDLLEKQRVRHEQQRALVQCAKELADVRTDPDRILTPIVAQAQRLLDADMAYLSLNDNERGETYMRVMVGMTSSAWRDVRIPFGVGVGGRVAATGTPFSTSDYFSDGRLTHDPAVDASVRAERQVSIVGVPLMREGTVIGVLFAANREVGQFSHDAIALLGSFAALAALAIDQARLMHDKEQALADLRRANEALERRSADHERGVAAHDRSMEIVLRGGGVQEVVAAATDQLGGKLAIFDEGGTPVARTPGTAEEVLRAMCGAAAGEVGRSGRSGHDGTYWVTRLLAGAENLGTLVWAPTVLPAEVGDQDRQLLERAAVVASLLQLFNRNLAAAEAQVRGELLDDLLAPTRHTYSSLAERAQRIGYDPRKRHAVVVAHLSPNLRKRLSPAASDLAAARDGLSTVRDGLALLVVPSADPSSTGRQISHSLSRRLGFPVTVGAAGPVDDPADLPAAYAEASACVHALLRLDRAGASATAADLGYAGLLLSGDRTAAQFVTRTLSPVIEYDRERSSALLETLETYFATGQSPALSAKRLHVHPNTITQRLERVKRLLGASWNSPEHALDVQLALRLNRLRSRLGE